MNKCWCAILFCVCSLGAVSGYDLRNPALNKVRFQSPPTHQEITLVKDGKLNFVLAYDSAVEKSIKSRYYQCIYPAVMSLRKHIERSTGQEPKLLDLAKQAYDPSQTVILVGDSRPVRSLGIDVRSLPREGFTVRSFAHGIVIAGNDSSLDSSVRPEDPLCPHGLRRATLWGVYDFLERFLGCRFYFPGAYGSLHPPVSSLRIAPFSYIDYPYFKNRGGYYMNVYPGRDEDYLGKLTQEQINDFYHSIRQAKTLRFTGMHSPFPEPWSKSNPTMIESSFFKNQYGHRYHSAVSHVENYYDVANLSFADNLIDSLKRFYASKGKDRQGWEYNNNAYIVFGQTDTRVSLAEMQENEFVKRENLITEAHRKSTAGGQIYSDIYCRFWQYLANRIKAVFPGRKLIIMPYSQYSAPPLDPKWTLPDNVEASVCIGSIPRWIRNPKTKARCLKMLKGWYKTLGNRPVQQIWTYNVGNSPFVQAIATELMGDIPKAFGKYLGKTEIFHEFNKFPNPTYLHYFFYYSTYAGMRAQWNPDFDVQAALDEHWKLFYGHEAGKHLKKFHDTLWDAYFKYASPECNMKPLYPPQVLDRLEFCLNEAERHLGKSTVEHRRFRLLARPMRYEIKAQRGRHSYNIPYYRSAQVLEGEAMTIDGVGDEPVWSRIPAIPLMDFNGSGIPRLYGPDCRIAWSPSGIYGFLEMPHEAKLDGKSMWSEDVAEFFFAPGLKKDLYFQFAFDPHNRQVSMKRVLKPFLMPSDFNWRCKGLQAKTTLKGKGWTLEFFIPFKGLGIPAPQAYQSWNFNFVYNKMSQPKEVSSSSMTLANNHNVDQYGVLIFAGKGDAFK